MNPTMTIEDMKQPGTILHKILSDIIVDMYIKINNNRHDKSLCNITVYAAAPSSTAFGQKHDL